MVATSAVAVGLSADAPPAIGWPIALAAVVVIGFAIVPLVPKGALRSARGLPSVILIRGLVAGAFFVTEAYIPYLLMAQFDFTPTWAGVALMFAAFAWAGGSALQGHRGESLGNRRIALISLGLLVAALSSVLLTAISGASPAIIVLGWAFAGAGMGLLYPRLTVLTLAYSSPGNAGFNSSALSISDATGSAVFVALAGLGVAALGGGADSFPLVFAFSIVVVVLAMVPGLRLGHGAESG